MGRDVLLHSPDVPFQSKISFITLLFLKDELKVRAKAQYILMKEISFHSDPARQLINMNAVSFSSYCYRTVWPPDTIGCKKRRVFAPVRFPDPIGEAS